MMNLDQQKPTPQASMANIQPSLNGVSIEQLEEALKVLENF